MSKQTVEQRYFEQKMIAGKRVPKGVAKKVITTQAQQNYQKLLQSTKQALQSASQSVQQVGAANPSETNLAIAAEKISFALQQVQQLETAGVQPGFTQGTAQQLTQLKKQLETASGTLGMIQQAVE